MFTNNSPATARTGMRLLFAEVSEMTGCSDGVSSVGILGHKPSNSANSSSDICTSILRPFHDDLELSPALVNLRIFTKTLRFHPV